jgi:hypothetical protein
LTIRRYRPLLLLALAAAVWFFNAQRADDAASDGADAVEQAFLNRTSDLVVEVEGAVERLLADDNDGSRHQRFIVRLAGGRTLLVAHNIDLAERVPLGVGDRVRLRGEYEWSERGGVLHWTHHDPGGRRVGGWIEHAGTRYN